jgi:outer membrane lipoprotein-sorting protein
MNHLPEDANLQPVPPRPDFYVTGGTLRPDALCYVERQADKDLCASLLRGEFCYVLTSRQMGKSSLMVRTVRHLRQEGIAVAVLDLTAIGQNLTIEQWYDGLTARLGQQLDLEDELLAFREAHLDWGPLQRWISAIETVVLSRISTPLVIFIDEIDLVRSLPFSTDEFFAAIRECYNRRAREPKFSRLAFGLLGVAAPSDLIRDTRMTPFNIGRRIELDDFTENEAAPLANGLGTNEATAQSLLGRVLHWTGGHPYLTQRLCSALAEALRAPPVDGAAAHLVPPALPISQTVDHLADKLFLSRQARERDDNLIFVRERILRSEADVPGLLLLYRKVHSGQPVPNDETNPLISILRLSGIARNFNGYLRVRNRIYRRVFDPGWIQANMPAAELRRQRRAGRRGMLIGFGIAVVVLLIYIFVQPMVVRYRQSQLARRTVRDLANAYREIRSYRDTFETTVELGLGGSTVPLQGSGSIRFEKPDKVHLDLKSAWQRPEVELRLVSDGHQAAVYAPLLNQYQLLERPPAPTPFDLPAPLAMRLGPVRILPLYRLLLADASADRLVEEAKNVQYDGTTELDNRPVRIIRWECPATAFLVSLGLTNTLSDRTSIPVSAWVSATNAMALRLRLDLSHWARELLGPTAELPVTSLIITESHRAIQTTDLPPSSRRFALVTSAGAQPVDRLELPPVNLSALLSTKRQFSNLIPPRIAQTPPNLIDLSEYFNAALVQTWHPGVTPNYFNNSLEELPPGLLQLGGQVFDVRGIVQLSGSELKKVGGQFPQQITGIKINQTCRQLHFLQAAGWRSTDGTTIGTYRLHYADGQVQDIPIVYGADVRDWNMDSDPSGKLTRSTVAWSGFNSARVVVRLYKTTWVNPLPETEIVSLDYVSAMTPSAPFLLAVTAEP